MSPSQDLPEATADIDHDIGGVEMKASKHLAELAVNDRHMHLSVSSERVLIGHELSLGVDREPTIV